MAYTTINKSTDYFNTKLYTGNGGTQSITDVGFQPDLTWIKQKGGTTNHVLYDAVRGPYWTMQSNTTNSQTADDGLTAWNSGGWNMANVSTTNGNGLSYVGWNWLGANGTAANTAGSISSTVSASTTSGFSIVQWTGNSGTVGHGLGVKPAMIIVKSKNTSNNWVVMNKNLTGGMDTNILVLNSNAAAGGGGAGMAEPTSSVFTITSGLAANDPNIAYCFADVQGYSKFGSYKGNGNADGAFIYTGFKPAFVIRKKTNANGNWIMQDNKRPSSQPFNEKRGEISGNTTSAETSSQYYIIDFLSNGFKCRTADSEVNGTGGEYIYMAFASAPQVGSNNVPCTAR